MLVARMQVYTLFGRYSVVRPNCAHAPVINGFARAERVLAS